MSVPRACRLLFVAAFIGVAALKMARLRQEGPARQAPAAPSESIRQFWGIYRRASQERASGDLTAAIADYQAALVAKPNHEDSLYYLGNCYFERGRYREAASAYQRLIAANPVGSSRGYMQMALLHADLQTGAPFDPGQAEKYFRQALQVNPDSAALLGTGEVALLEGEWEKAAEAFRGVNTDNSTSVAAPYLLGYLSWRKGEREEAGRWFRLAVKRCKVKKLPVQWSQEGEIKADPELRWRALARQSVFGSHWLRLRRYLNTPDLKPALIEQEYQRLRQVVAAAQRHSGAADAAS